jgi:hypothetical protein
MKSPDGTCFIDRDPTYFPHILSYLRGDGQKLIPNSTTAREDLLKEASFYQLSGLVPLLTSTKLFEILLISLRPYDS